MAVDEAGPTSGLFELVNLQCKIIDIQTDVLAEYGFEPRDLAVRLDAERREHRRCWYKRFTGLAAVYLVLNLLSTQVPGPMTWLDISEHVRLFHHIAQLV